MKQRRAPRALAGALFALFLLPATPIAAQQRAVADERQGHVSGKVTDGNGEPVSDVKVSITTKAISSFRKELKTGEDGTWATTLVDATGTYRYRFEKAGFVTVEKEKKVPFGTPTMPSVYTVRTSRLDVQLSAPAPAAKDRD
jgi:Carboxypeptidase regulatory-like domain